MRIFKRVGKSSPASPSFLETSADGFSLKNDLTSSNFTSSVLDHQFHTATAIQTQKISASC